MATRIERTYSQLPDPEMMKKLAQVILKIGLRILNEEAKVNQIQVYERVG
jgi:hypothetical protein